MSTKGTEVLASGVRQFSSRRRHQSAAGSYTRLRRKYLWWALGISWLLILIILQFAYWRLSVLQEEKQEILVSLRKAERKLEQLRPELQNVNEQVSALVAGRLPDLQMLKYDKVIQLSEGYVKNVVFTLLKKGKEHAYEFKMVMENDSLSPIRPRVDVLVFDKLGIQLGTAEVEQGDNGIGTRNGSLEPGETRSYSSVIPLSRRGEPTYFLVSVDPASLGNEASGITSE